MIHPKLDEDEKLIVALQDHWVTMVIPVLVFLMGMGLSAVIAVSAVGLFDAPLFRGIALLFSLGVGLIFTHWLFIYALEHEVSAWIVTSKRLILFQFLPYVRHDVSFVSISEMHEIDKRKHGLLQNLLNYGDVKIELAANPDAVILKYVPRTSAFVNLIETLHETPPDDLDIERLKANYFA